MGRKWATFPAQRTGRSADAGFERADGEAPAGARCLSAEHLRVLEADVQNMRSSSATVYSCR